VEVPRPLLVQIELRKRSQSLSSGESRGPDRSVLVVAY
jgi:hypothetical protein